MGTAPSCRVCARRIRICVPLVALAAAIAFLPPALADEPGLSLGLAGSGEQAPSLDPGWPSPAPHRFGLGLDQSGPAARRPAPDPTDQPAGGSPTPEPSLAPTAPTLAALPGHVWQDLGVFVKRPLAFDSRDWTRLAIGAGLVGVVSAFDVRLRDSVQAHTSASARSFATRIRPLGTWGGLAAMGVLYGVGELAHDDGLAGTGADGLEATLFSAGLVAPALKELAGRQRPSATNGVGGFELLSRGQSFPSGEATEAFTLAAVVSNHTTSPVVRGLAWGLAGLVGWERMALNAHWASDVVAGALIGGTVGTWVSHRSAAGEEGRSFALRPMVGPGVVGVSGAVSW